MNEQYLERYEIEARRIKQRAAARTMLKALKEAQGELAQFEVTLPEVDAAIAQAEAAGITVQS